MLNNEFVRLRETKNRAQFDAKVKDVDTAMQEYYCALDSYLERTIPGFRKEN